MRQCSVEGCENNADQILVFMPAEAYELEALQYTDAAFSLCFTHQTQFRGLIDLICKGAAKVSIEA